MKIAQRVEINPTLNLANYMHQDNKGFNCFKIVRCCELVSNDPNQEQDREIDCHDDKFTVIQDIKF